MTGCNHGKSDDELTRKDLFDVIEIYKKENTELKKQEGVVIAEGEILEYELMADNIYQIQIALYPAEADWLKEGKIITIMTKRCN